MPFVPPPELARPGRLMRMSRGFSCLFWSMPLLSAAHAAAWRSVLPVHWMIGVLLAGFLPLGCGLGMFRACGNIAPQWNTRTGRVLLLALVGASLSPFLVWWRNAPTRGYLAANAAAHYLVMIALLGGLNRLAGAAARRMKDVPLEREARAGLIMVLWLGFCTLGALVWLYYRSGVIEAGVTTVLIHLAQLPTEAHMLFVLPYAMTAYVMWRAKETGFRGAVRPGP